MARILIASWGSYGDVYPYVGLALALRDQAHQPIIATAEFYRGLIESLGIEFHPVGPTIDPDDRRTIERLLDPVRGADALLNGIVVPAVRADYAALDPIATGADLIVTHPITFAGPIVAQARGLPWVSTVLAPLSFFSAADPPVLAPAPFLAGLARFGSWYGRTAVALARYTTNSWMTPVHELRRELGLPRGDHPLFEGQFSPSLTLALFSRVLADPQPDWPPHVRITGSIFYNGPDGLQPELEAFLNTGPSPVVFTLGSSAVAAAGWFYEESLAAIRRLGIRAVLLTGGFEQNRPTAALPEGVLLLDRAPHQLLFPRAAAVVHPGGAGTLAQALRAGKPMLVVPHAHDQPDNASRARKLGVARIVSPRRYRGPRVASDIGDLLNDTRVAARASEIANVVRSEGGASAAAAEIAALCA